MKEAYVGSRDLPNEAGLIAIYYEPQQWVGALNPNLEDTHPLSISMFGGVGLDGDGDGLADPNNDEDVLYTFASHLEFMATTKKTLKSAYGNFIIAKSRYS